MYILLKRGVIIVKPLFVSLSTEYGNINIFLIITQLLKLAIIIIRNSSIKTTIVTGRGIIFKNSRCKYSFRIRHIIFICK